MKVLAMDCEMVGVGPDGKRSALARVSIVNRSEIVVYDKFVRPAERVTDYRTPKSGVRPSDLRTAEDFATVQTEVADILKHRLLVGHALHHDFGVLSLKHPQNDIRDTQNYGPFLKSDGRAPGLKYLADFHLGTQIQQGEHDSVEDARTALSLYLLHQKAWEKSLKKRPRGHESARNPKKVSVR